jgi:hypothetical protein
VGTISSIYAIAACPRPGVVVQVKIQGASNLQLWGTVWPSWHNALASLIERARLPARATVARRRIPAQQKFETLL